MTTLNEANEVIYAKMTADWNLANGDLTFDGEDYKPGTAAWVRLSVRHTTPRQETLGQTGNRRFERAGSVIVQVFTPAAQGRAAADNLSSLVRSIFEGKSISGLCFFESDIRELGLDGLWYQVVVESKFTYNETK